MNWSYVAGLFDGEGSISMSYNSRAIKLHVNLSISYEPSRHALQEFLSQNGITSGIAKNVNPLGTGYRVAIQNWESCERFISSVFPFSIEKHRHLIVAQNVLALRGRIKARDETFTSHIPEFDSLRRQLHALANKGRPLTKEWSILK